MQTSQMGMGGARDRGEGASSEASGEASGEAKGVTAMDVVGALSDAELLDGTRRLVCQSNRVFAALLLHLAEVEARGLHRTRACASLYTYCIYELRMSEDAAFRRVAAARWVKRFPVLFGAVERGELHLTALLLIGPHLTDVNVGEVVARAKFRTKKEVVKLVRLLSPLPDVPSRIEPLGLDRPRVRPTWGNLMAARLPVRELRPEERPSSWLPASEDVMAVSSTSGDGAHSEKGASVRGVSRGDGRGGSGEPPPARHHSRSQDEASNDAQLEAPAPSASLEPAAAKLAGPQRYCVQFTE